MWARTALASVVILFGVIVGGRSPPPAGARCTGHALPPPLGIPAEIFVNATLIPLNWSVAATCPRLPPTEWVCCQEVQFNYLTTQLRIMDFNFQECEACNIAIRDMWCHYTCSPFQGDYDHPLMVNDTTGQIMSTELVVSQNFAARLWKSCRNAIFANQFLVKVMFPDVSGLFQSFADFSPPVQEIGAKYPTGHIVRRVYIQEPNAALPAPGLIPLNISLVENEYSCSDGKIAPLPRTFPLPKATVGTLSAQAAVGILLGCLVVGLTAVGALNAKHDRALADSEIEVQEEEYAGGVEPKGDEEQQPLVSKKKLNGHAATNGTNGHSSLNGHNGHGALNGHNGNGTLNGHNGHHSSNGKIQSAQNGL